jgi:hypothetical protein
LPIFTPKVDCAKITTTRGFDDFYAGSSGIAVCLAGTLEKVIRGHQI